jgi:diguanylate cyclase (GGDEF)-like protein/PAS domain S-box-containing protein
MQAAVSGLPQIFEWTHLRHDGTTFDAEVSLNRGLTPEAGYLLAIVRDITERKQAEESLLFKTALLEAESETTIDGILAADESDHIILVNKQFGLHFGVPHEVLSSEDELVVRKYVTEQVEDPALFIDRVEYLYSHRDEKSRDEFRLKNGKTFDRYSAPLVDSKGRHRGRIWYFRDITARKQAEEALLQAGALQSAIFNSANFSSIATDAKGVIQIFNVGAERMLGYTAAEVMNKITPADISDPQEVIARAAALSVELGTPITPGFEALVFKASRGIEDIYELTYIRKDGSRFPAVVSVTALRDAQNVIIGYLLIGTDNTARKLAEEALLQAGALQRAIFNSANFSSIATDAKGVIQIFNVGAERMLGYTAAEVMNKITPADISDPQEVIARAAALSVELGTPITPGFEALAFKASRGIEDIYELTYIRKDGSRFPAVVSVTALRDAQNAIIGYLLIGTDNTARKQAEESLKLFRLLIDQSHDAIQVIDLETMRLLDVNASACSSLGYTREELLSMRVYDIDPTIDESARVKVEESLRNLGFVIIQTIQRRKNGSTFPVEMSMKLVHLDRNYVVCALRDISERKQMESALEEANAKLRIALAESEEQAREAIKLTELVDILQSCQTAEEAYRIIGNTLPTTLSSPSGALCMTTPSRNIVEAVAVWGGVPITEKTFAPDDCWALRRGKIHRVNDAASPLRCAHVSESLAGGYLCVPLAAQGETLGALCLENPSPPPNPSLGSPEDPMEALARQASAVAERISLVLANLRVREVLRSQSIRDPLTGLFNRRFMEESLEREVRRAARNKEGVAVLMLDLDRFKLFNDTFGHQAGDVLLRGFGDFLSQGTRGQDVSCRYGGEEFLLVLSGASIDAACKRAELLREGLKQLTVRHAGQVLGRITVSIGVSAFPGHGATGEELVRAADKALYRAKEEGRDRVVVADPMNTQG